MPTNKSPNTPMGLTCHRRSLQEPQIKVSRHTFRKSFDHDPPSVQEWVYLRYFPHEVLLQWPILC